MFNCACCNLVSISFAGLSKGYVQGGVQKPVFVYRVYRVVFFPACIALRCMLALRAL